MSFVRLGATLVNLDCINAQLVAERTTQLIAVSDHSSGKFLLALSRTITISAIEAAPSPRSRSAKRNPGPFAPSDNRKILIPGVDHLHHAGFFVQACEMASDLRDGGGDCRSPAASLCNWHAGLLRCYD